MAKSADTLLEIEIDNPQNLQLYYAPIQRRIRGGWDFMRVPEPLAKQEINKWPKAIPGQRLQLDTATGEAAIIEPLYEPEHAATRRAIEQTGKGGKGGKLIPPERESLGIVDVATHLFWIKAAVTNGLARVVRGVLPEKIDGEPQRSFLSHRQPAANDRLAAALESITAVNREILAQLRAK